MRTGYIKNSIAALALTLASLTAAISQTTTPKKNISPKDLENRPADHFILQFGYNGIASKPDSIQLKGFGRYFNFYCMFDKPVKNHPHLSYAYGIGIGSNNVYFDNQIPNLAATTSTLPFNIKNGDKYKKSKLTNVFLEIPAEIRYYQKPQNTNSGFKAALGLKAGLLFKSYTKGKDLQNSAGTSYYGKTYTDKVSNKRYINGNKLAVYGRVGYGILSLHAEYNVLGIIKDGFGPVMNLYQIGISIGGL